VPSAENRQGLMSPECDKRSSANMIIAWCIEACSKEFLSKALHETRLELLQNCSKSRTYDFSSMISAISRYSASGELVVWMCVASTVKKNAETNEFKGRHAHTWTRGLCSLFPHQEVRGPWASRTIHYTSQ
jgi:hypothetical protein